MGITDKMNQVVGSIQTSAKVTSISLFSLILKIGSALVLSLVLSMIGQELMSYGSFSFLFVLVVMTGIVTRILYSWSIGAVLIFDLICILVALLLRMYILVAP